MRRLFLPVIPSSKVRGDKISLKDNDLMKIVTGGCGRFFEGTADQMYTALIEKLSILPDETKVFCGHEYTLGNLKFGNHVEPENKDILNRIEWANTKRAASEPTVPSTIADEKLINPFMRVHTESVQKFANSLGDPIATMTFIRQVKDSFK